MKKPLILAWMHLSVLCGITVFIYQHKIWGRDALELYLSYVPLWLVNYNMLESPANKTGAIISCAMMAVACLFAAFYFRAYYLIFASSAVCAMVAPLIRFGSGSIGSSTGTNTQE